MCCLTVTSLPWLVLAANHIRATSSTMPTATSVTTESDTICFEGSCQNVCNWTNFATSYNEDWWQCFYLYELRNSSLLSFIPTMKWPKLQIENRPNRNKRIRHCTKVSTLTWESISGGICKGLRCKTAKLGVSELWSHLFFCFAAGQKSTIKTIETIKIPATSSWCVSLARFCVHSEDKVRLEKVCFHVSKHCGDKDKIMKMQISNTNQGLIINHEYKSK